MRVGGRSVIYARIPRGPYRVEKTTLGGSDKAINISTVERVAKVSLKQTDLAISKDAPLKKVVRPAGMLEKAFALDSTGRHEKLVRITGTAFHLGEYYLGEAYLGIVPGDFAYGLDVLSKSYAFTRTPIDHLEETDTPLSKSTLKRFVSNTAEEIDATERVNVSAKFVADALHSTSTVNRLVTFTRTASDEEATLDTVVRKVANHFPLQDISETYDVLGQAGGGFQFINDILRNTDSNTRKRSLPRSVEDSSLGLDNLFKHVVAIRLPTDPLAATDTPERLLSLIRSVTTPAISKDKPFFSGSRIRYVTDEILSLDATSRKGSHFIRTASGDESLSTDFARIGGKKITLNEILLGLDRITKTERTTVKELFDTLLISGEKIKVVTYYAWEHGRYDYVVLPYTSKISNITFVLAKTPTAQFEIKNNLLHIPRLTLVSAVEKAAVEAENS